MGALWGKEKVEKGGKLNRPKMPLVRFDQLEQNGVEIKFLNTLTSSGECLGMVGVVRSAFRVPCLLGIALFYGVLGPPMPRGGFGGILPPL